MDRRRILALFMMFFAIIIIIGTSIWFLTPLGANALALGQPDLNGPALTPLAFKPLPVSKPVAVLTVKGSPDDIGSQEALLMDADTGNILYASNAELPVPMASTTKIMTALLAIQSGKLGQQVTIGQDAPNEVIENDGSSAQLVVGDKITLQDLLYGLMLPSGDDAAVAIADAVAGSVDNFVTIMNVEAQKLGLFQTHYVNADGLPPTDDAGNPINGIHYTTAYDLVRLARYAMQLPLFAKIVQTKTYSLAPGATHHGYQWVTTNELLGVYGGMLGIKTGTTPEAGACLVFAARRNNHTLIGVVLHALTDDSRFQDTKTLLDWGFGLPLQIPQA